MTYGVAKEIARNLEPLVGTTIYHVNKSKEFADQIRNTKIGEGEYITSFDATALFTAVPVAFALNIVKNSL